MNEMIERCAKAGYDFICLAVPHMRDWRSIPESHKDQYRGIVMAAFKAMREPTDAMLEAGRYVSDGDFNIGKSAALDCWQAMIDVIIRDQ